MVCSHCQADYENGASDTCPTCGFSIQSEEDLATRITPSETSIHTSAYPSVESDIETNGARQDVNGRYDSPSAEADIATGSGGAAERPQSAASERQPGSGSPIPGWTSAAGPSTLDGAVCLMPGVVLGGRYEIQKQLGEGGMGAVYKARDLEVNRAVAIKIIRAELANDPLILQRFKQELVLARQVTHRNVVRIYDLGVASGLRFISMEYIEGRELSDVLRERGKCKPREAAEIMLQVCRGLEAAHAQGVIHRDLKPQNIMVDAQGRAAVMDFGIAHTTVDSEPEESGTAPTFAEGLTHAGALIGTPRYMSPEQAHAQPVDGRSDIYTVGLIFYELLTGKLPFTAPSVKQLIRNRGKETAAALTSVDPSIPKRLNGIVLKCLESSPERRYQSVTALIEDLELWLGIRTRAGAKGLKRWTAAASLVAVIAILGLAFLLHQRFASEAAKAHPPVTALITDFRNETGQPILTGVAEPMLQVAIERASFINSFNRGQAQKIAAAIKPGFSSLDEGLGRLVALREGIGVVIGGVIERHGGGLELSATATDSSGKLLGKGSADFDRPNDLPKAVDKVASRIRRVLGDVTHSSDKSAAETFTSGSLASARLYAAAQQLQWEGKWTEAIATWKQAVALDPKMSRAYAGIAATLANLGERKDAVHYYRLALANIDRESDREKYRTRGGYYLLMRDYPKAAEQFGQLVKQYPADSAGLANLALADFYARNMNAALEQGRKAVQLYPHNILQRNNLGLYAMYAGDFASAIKESETIIKMNPAFEKAYLCLGISQLQSGLPDSAIATYTKLQGLSQWGASEGALALGDLAMYQGRFADAAKVLQAGITADASNKKSTPAAVKLVALAQAQIHNRQRSAALRSVAQALAMSDDESVLYGAAEVELQAGDLRQVSSIAKKLNDRFEPEPRALGKLIEGEAQMQEGKLHEAVSSFEDSQKLADTWLGRYDLGRAYIAAMLYPEAENELDICIKRRGEASAAFLDDEPTVRYLPAAYYYLGIAKDGLNSSDAQDEFKTFLAMKRGADPDPMIADAKHKVRVQ